MCTCPTYGDAALAIDIAKRNLASPKRLGKTRYHPMVNATTLSSIIASKLLRE